MRVRLLIGAAFVACLLAGALGIRASAAPQSAPQPDSCQAAIDTADAAAKGYRAALKAIDNACTKSRRDCQNVGASAQSALNAITMAHEAVIAACVTVTPPPPSTFYVVSATATSASRIEVLFNAPVNPATVDQSSFTFTGGWLPVMGAYVSWTNPNAVWVDLMGSTVPGAIYTVTVPSTIMDVSGNVVDPAARMASFTGWMPPVPTFDVVIATATSPTTIDVVFSGAVLPSTIDSNFTFSGGLQTQSASSSVMNSSIVTVTTSSAMSPGNSYTVTAPSTIKDINGNFVNPSARTASFVGWQPFQVVSATAMSATTVVINFNMIAGDPLPARFTFSPGLPVFGAVRGFMPNQVTLTTSVQTPGVTYTVTVDPTFTSGEGTPVSSSANSATFVGWPGM